MKKLTNDEIVELVKEKKSLQDDWLWANKELKSKRVRQKFVAKLATRWHEIEALLKSHNS